MANLPISKDPSLGLYVQQWHPTKNINYSIDKISSGSREDIWWVCSDFSDHEWQATPLARIAQRQGCPICLNRTILTGFNDFAHMQPELMKQWHPTLNTLNPEEIAPSASKEAYWICPVGEDHVWAAKVNSRVSGGNNCPYCANRKILVGFNDLGSSSHEKIIKEWHPTKNEKTVTEVSVASNQKVWWLCENNHEWSAIIANRTTKGSGCPDCRKLNKIPSKKETVDNSKLSTEWHPDNIRMASEVSVGSNYDALWKCSKDSRHVWNATVSNRMRGSGCLVCSDRKIISGVNDLASIEEFSYLVDQWHPDNELSPSQVALGNDVLIKWICSENHIWKANLYNRTKKLQNCPECLGRTVWTESKKSISDYPELEKQLHRSNKLKSIQIPFRSSKIITWVCPKNDKHIWNAPPASRSLDGSDCPVCAGRVIIEGVNDFASNTTWNFLLEEWHVDNIVKPTEISYSSATVIQWACKKDSTHKWSTPLSSRTHAKAPSGCPRCALASQTSKGESEVYTFLKMLGFNAIQRETQVINGELDLYIPEKNFGIEYNGVYWHSEAVRPDKNYHAKKLAECKKNDVYLYNVWEDDWRSKKEIIIRGIAHRLGASERLVNVFPDMPKFWTEKVGARKTKIITLNYGDASKFLDMHHIQGSASGSFYLGLVDNANRVRAVMVLARTSKEGELLISRYATAGVVSGGFTKLLKYAENEFDFLTWVTFADLSLSDGNLYDAHGFTVDAILRPDYSYLVKGSRVHKFNYRLQRFRRDPELVFIDGLSEQELANINNLHRVWDFGKKRYTKTVAREMSKD